MLNPFWDENDPPTDSDIQVTLGDDRYGLWQMVVREICLLFGGNNMHWAGEVEGWVCRFVSKRGWFVDLMLDGVCFVASFDLTAQDADLAYREMGRDSEVVIKWPTKNIEPSGLAEVRLVWPVRLRNDAQHLVRILRRNAGSMRVEVL
jgi:hypothetical protein